MLRRFNIITVSIMAVGLLARLLSRLSIVLMFGLLSGCSVIAALSYYSSEEESEPGVAPLPYAQNEVAVHTELDNSDALVVEAYQSPVPQGDEYLIGEMVMAVSAAIDAPEQPESIDTIARYGTDSRYYVMIRGWLKQELNGVQSQLGSTSDHSDRTLLEKKSEFLQASIRRIDLE